MQVINKKLTYTMIDLVVYSPPDKTLMTTFKVLFKLGIEPLFMRDLLLDYS